MTPVPQPQEEQILDDWYAGLLTDEEVAKRLRVLGFDEESVKAWMEGEL